MHFASAPHDRCIQRTLRWTPGARQIAGCPRYNCVTKISFSARFCFIGNWQLLAQDPAIWYHLTEEFVQIENSENDSCDRFCLRSDLVISYGVGFHGALAPKKAAHGHASLID